MTHNANKISALEAITEAQKIAFAPMLFQATVSLKRLGILKAIEEAFSAGLSKQEIVDKTQVNYYAVSILLDIGCNANIVYQEDDKFFLGKIGHFLLNDKMTQVNMNFTQDVCYQGLFLLQDSLTENKPHGLKFLSEHSTIYPALQTLPEDAKKSWFEFDHYYSDMAFDVAFDAIAYLNPKVIFDIGGNTGKWAFKCCEKRSDIHVKIIDLPEQVNFVEKKIASSQMTDRISVFESNVLSNDPFPKGADIWWMSQFLDCFSEEQIVFILKKIVLAMHDDARVCIMELFGDKQKYEASAFSINATSLYFTCMANGYSRFYESKVFYQLIDQAGLVVEKAISPLGECHTLLICKKK